MTTLLFPGRHLLHTEFQVGYLSEVLEKSFDDLEWIDEQAPDLPPITRVVFAITSCNQQNSRYNSIPFHVRAIGVDRFARSIKQTREFAYRIYGIPHYQPTPRFSANLLKEIEAQSNGDVLLTPDNCVVLSSTDSVIRQYRDLGFGVLPAELNASTDAPTPVEVLKQFVNLGDGWNQDPILKPQFSPTTVELWQDFPNVPTRILRLWNDPLLNDAGSLTETRDYSTYAYAMAKPGAIQLKYDDIRPAIRPGKIVDEGCADGALLSLMAKDFPDSDLIGIELTGEFLARCRERQRTGDFGGTFVHFYQRNIMNPIFAPNSIDTTICNSTIHELWSYGSQQQTVDAYLKTKFEQTEPGGRLIVRDVVGPENKDQTVYLWLNDADGLSNTPNSDVQRSFSNATDLTEFLNGLSTYQRFLRFAEDYLKELRASGKRATTTKVTFEESTLNDRRFVKLPLRHAAEFLAKMTYTHNWASEMFEEFTFWDFDEWCAAFRRAGFQVVQGHADEVRQTGSWAYCNPWLVENRFRGRAEIFAMNDGQLEVVDFPNTNIVIVGEKPANAF